MSLTSSQGFGAVVKPRKLTISMEQQKLKCHRSTQENAVPSAPICDSKRSSTSQFLKTLGNGKGNIKIDFYNMKCLLCAT